MAIHYKGNFIYIQQGYKLTILHISSIHSLSIDRRKYTIQMEAAGKTLEFKFQNHYNQTMLPQFYSFLHVLQQALGLDTKFINGETDDQEDEITNEVSSD